MDFRREQISGESKWPRISAISAGDVVGKVGLWGGGGDLGQDGLTKKVDLEGVWARKGWILGQCGARRADHFRGSEVWSEVNLALMMQG